MFDVNRWMLRLLALPLAVLLGVLMLPAAANAAGEPEIEARWTALGGATGVLGAKLPPPKDVPYDVPGGRAQDFTAGSIFWSSATGAWEVRGAILTAYLAAGGPGGALGFPTDAAAPSAVAGAVRQVFTGGRIYSSAATGAHAVTGPILAKYDAIGSAGSSLGLPTGDAAPSVVAGAVRQVFAGGRIYWSAATGASTVTGPILAKYDAMGSASSYLGLPTGDAAPSVVAGAVRQVFTGGRIYWSSATGANAIRGAILARYDAIGSASSYLGLPTTSEYAVSGGRRNRFVRGRITYYPGKGTTVTGYWRPSVQGVTAADVPYTYRSGCPVGPSGLRRVKMPFYDWAGVPKFGDLIIRTSSADDMQRVFNRAFSGRFPIRQMRPVDVWQGSDIRAMEADNTSAFNCRKVTGNPTRLSQHSYGNAIDINTVENPYVTSSQVYPSGSGTYLNRSNVRKGMIVSSGPIARGMAAEGWPWGARWSNPDYQHFSSNGG
jgi:D-alanyl-D-alanine carboxypeptidase/LGFP repeat